MPDLNEYFGKADTKEYDAKQDPQQNNGLVDTYARQKRLQQNVVKNTGQEFKDITGTDYDTAKDIIGPDFNIHTQDTPNLLGANQAVGSQILGFLNQAATGEIIGGTLEGIGYLGDVSHWVDRVNGEEGDWGNWLSDIGKDMKTWTQDTTPVFQRGEGFNPGSSGWWFSHGVSVASTLSLMIPAMGTVKGVSALGKAMRIANNLGKEAKFAATVLGQATVSRHMENMMEASQVFDQTYNEILSQTNPDTGEKFTPEEAKKHASEAASFTYKANWPMIAKDIMQYALLARGTGMSKAIDDVALAKAAGKSAASAALLKGYGVATDLASEGMEEAYQFIVGEEGRHFAKVQAGIEEDGKFRERFGSYLKDGEMWTAALFGALGAGVAHSVKPLINKLQPSDNVSETQSRIDEIKSRSERIAYHAQKLKEAQATGNEDAVKQAKADMAFEMGTRAAKTGNLDLILENLEQIKGMSKEEKEANNFDDSFTENIEEAKRNIEEAATLYSKAAKKYHVATAESIAKLQFENQNLGKSAEEANIKVSEAKSKYPRLADLSAAGNRSLDTQVTIAANDIRIHQLEKLLQDTNISEDEKESYLKLHTNAVADNNKLLEDLKEIHPETTVEDRKILKGIETPLADDLISAKAVEQYTKERIDINTDALLKITSNKFQNGVQAKLDAAAKAKIEEDKLNNSNQAVNTATQEVEAASNPEQSNEGEVPGTPATEEDMDDFLYGLEEEEDGTAAAKPIEIKPTTQQMIEGNQVVSGNIAEELPVPENTTVEKQNSVVSVDEKVDNSSANPFMLTYMSASNSNASLMQQNDTELIELAEFLENPNNPLTQYELELSIDEKFLEENRPLNELGITKTLKAGKELDANQAAHLPIQVIFKLNGIPVVNSKGNPHRAFIRKPNDKMSDEQLQQLVNLKKKVLTSSNGKVVTSISDKTRGYISFQPSNVDGHVKNNVAVVLNTEAKNLQIIVGNSNKQYVDVAKGPVFELEGFSTATPGAFYASVQMANGEMFPLRLHSSRLTAEEANLVYNLYKELSQDISLLNKPIADTIKYLIQTSKDTRVSQISGSLNTMTYSELLSTLVYEGQNAKGTKKVYLKDGALTLGSPNNVLSKQELADEANKDKVVNYLVSSINRQVNLKKLSDPTYKEYIITNELLTTNAKPTSSKSLFAQPGIVIGSNVIDVTDNVTVIAGKKKGTKKTQPSPTAPIVDVKANIESQKVDIEQRRQDELNDLKKKRQFDKKNTDPINAKYDAELAALETAPAVVNPQIQAIKNNLSKYDISVSKDENYYVVKNEATGEVKTYNRVTRYLKNDKVPDKNINLDSSVVVGSTLDSFARSLFNNATDKSILDKITKDPALQNKIEEEFTKLRNSYPEGTQFVADEITLWDDVINVAGTIDMLAVLPDGSIELIDFKGFTEKTIVNFSSGFKNNTTGETASSKSEETGKQLDAYRILLENQYGIKITKRSLAIIPVDYTREKNPKLTYVGNLTIRVPKHYTSIRDLKVNPAPVVQTSKPKGNANKARAMYGMPKKSKKAEQTFSKIEEFYVSLPKELQDKLGSKESIIEKFTESSLSEEEYVEKLKCSL